MTSAEESDTWRRDEVAGGEPQVVLGSPGRQRVGNSTLIPRVLGMMDKEDLLSKVRGRVGQCRRLARHVADEHTKRVLLQMANEAEEDLRRREAKECEQQDQRCEG
ncbi:hypothetical protein OMW55_11705 [Sphingomonas sp. BN140010]|uniref:Uncharacterized protein n=1 Tax=Sphingomonas arvum TaxID=2992113 RepID=A0ABT3JHB2_9SPHN|nr:hypothetical protein [Sphingomonas sp. BN140010]MCW3798470.1 hypothetical protein [Sphingomonas sp. BN140010]